MEAWAVILSTLRNAGFSAWLVGGCVRDLLLGVPPKDYDVATNARPEQIAELFPQALAVGAHFGVMLLNGVEVATYRSDGTYADGRRPDSVRFETDPNADACRRDFTINGMFLDPDTGEVLDFVGGRKDLANRIIRAIGDPERRFAEDHLRILRAVRFAARLGFDIEPRTMEAMRLAAESVRKMAVERVFGELNRILTEGGASRGMELLDQSRVLEILLPEVKAMQGIEQPPEYHPEGDVWVHTLKMLELMGKADADLAWGVLLHDVGKPVTMTQEDRIRFSGHDRVGAEMSRQILTRLRAPNALVERVEAMVQTHMRFNDLPRMRVSTTKRFLRQDYFPQLLNLHRLDCLGSGGRLESHEFAVAKMAELGQEELQPAPLVTGRDVMALGVPAGPRVGALLREVEEAQLEGALRDRNAALEWLRKQVSEPSST